MILPPPASFFPEHLSVEDTIDTDAFEEALPFATTIPCPPPADILDEDLPF